MNNQKIMPLTALAASAFVLVGCSAAGTPAATQAPAVTASQAPASAPAQTTQPATTAPASSAPAGDADAHNESARAAVKAAEAEVNGRAVALDHDGDADENWEVDVVAGDRVHEIDVDRAGTVVKTEKDDALEAEDRAKLDKATVTILQAVDAALENTPGTLDDVELDEEDGKVIWEVTIDTAQNDDIDVYVDAASGAIVKKG